MSALVRGGDRGAASLWLLAVGLLLVAAGLFAAAVGAATLARHRAQSAADLGALAGARWALWGADVACAEAAGIVAANGAAMAWCRLDGVDVLIGVDVAVSPLPGLRRTARAAARAGPVMAGPGGGAASAAGDALFTLRARTPSGAGRLPPGHALRGPPARAGRGGLAAGLNCS